LPPPLPPRPDPPAGKPAQDTAESHEGEESDGTPTIVLQEEDESIDPTWRGAGVVGQEKIDVKGRRSQFTVRMTGAAYAHCYIGVHSLAAPTLRLVQPFEVTPGDPKDPWVVLTLSGKIDGYIRSAPQGSACLRVASAAIYPDDGGPMLGLAFPPACISDEAALRCNREVQLPPWTVPAGRFVLVAELAFEAVAEGVFHGHAEAVFAPAARRSTWEHKPGPFANVDAKDFGLTITLKVAAP
jgi:hypothetical protein